MPTGKYFILKLVTYGGSGFLSNLFVWVEAAPPRGDVAALRWGGVCYCVTSQGRGIRQREVEGRERERGRGGVIPRVQLRFSLKTRG